MTVRIRSAVTGAISLAAVEFLQSFALHLQFHLGILLEDLRVSLAKHLSHPLIGYASSTQPRGIRESKVVDSEVGNLCPRRVLLQTVLNGLPSASIPIAREQKRIIRYDGPSAA